MPPPTNYAAATPNKERRCNPANRERRTVLDRRYKPPKIYEAVECEAIKQTTLVKLVRKWLDAQQP